MHQTPDLCPAPSSNSAQPFLLSPHISFPGALITQTPSPTPSSFRPNCPPSLPKTHLCPCSAPTRTGSILSPTDTTLESAASGCLSSDSSGLPQGSALLPGEGTRPAPHFTGSRPLTRPRPRSAEDPALRPHLLLEEALPVAQAAQLALLLLVLQLLGGRLKVANKVLQAQDDALDGQRSASRRPRAPRLPAEAVQAPVGSRTRWPGAEC